jgi:hypothetical protein
MLEKTKVALPLRSGNSVRATPTSDMEVLLGSHFLASAQQTLIVMFDPLIVLGESTLMYTWPLCPLQKTLEWRYVGTHHRIQTK